MRQNFKSSLKERELLLLSRTTVTVGGVAGTHPAGGGDLNSSALPSAQV